MNVVAVKVNRVASLVPRTQRMRLAKASYFRGEMDANRGGLATLLAAAEFVESQDQKKSDKLIEICEYPSSEKKLAVKSTSFLSSLKNVTIAARPSSVVPKMASKNIKITSSNPPCNIISTPLSSLVPSSSMVVTTLPSFSPSPSLTFTFTTPSTANQTSLLTLPTASIRLPTVVTTIQQHVQTPILNEEIKPFAPTPILPTQRTITKQNSTTISSSLSYTQSEKLVIESEGKRKLSSGTREVHNKLEKNRRAHLKECFEILKGQVPAIQDERKPSNLTILRTAIRYVQILRRREQELESELERLAREKIVHQQRLTTLKEELLAQWDHIDFDSLLLDSLEPAKAAGQAENDANRQQECENEKEADMKIEMSDIDDTSSHMKFDTYYGSSSPNGSCSVSPLHISSPSVITTASNTLPPQIHIVESSAVFNKLSDAAMVSPLQFLSSSGFKVITEQPVVTLVEHKEGVAASPTSSVNHKNVKSCFTQSMPNGVIIPTSVGQKVLTTTVPVHTNMASLVNHSFVVSQPSSGQMMISAASPHLPTSIMTMPPRLKTVSRLQSINGHQLVMKPDTAAVVVSSTTAASE